MKFIIAIMSQKRAADDLAAALGKTVASVPIPPEALEGMHEEHLCICRQLGVAVNALGAIRDTSGYPESVRNSCAGTLKELQSIQKDHDAQA